ncbi:MAG: alpha/beta hydrolase-fold protein [Rhizomicrobium sp.]
MTTVETLGAATIRGSESFALGSAQVDETFLVDVAAPLNHSGKALPVIYVLDGSQGFGLAAQTVSQLQLGRLLPAAIVVGIGYRAEMSRVRSLRLRDFTPDADGAYLARVAGTPDAPADGVAPGGAAAFLRFVQEELKPFIESRYAVDRTDQTLVGMSLGGLFALHTLFDAPRSFQRYLALSPSIWWHDRAILARESAFARQAPDLPVNLFLSIGALEEAEYASARMVSNLYELHARLAQRPYKTLRLAMEVFAGETHGSVYPAALSRGLRTVFGTAPGFSDWATPPG